MGWISFFHTDSRRGDPQIHSHVVVISAVASRESQKVGSLHTRRMWGQLTHYREVYQRELSENLRARGIDAAYDHERKEAWVRGIPENAVEAFSQRRNTAVASAEREASERHGRELLELAVNERRRLINKAIMLGRSEKGEHKPDPAEWKQRAASIGWMKQWWITSRQMGYNPDQGGAGGGRGREAPPSDLDAGDLRWDQGSDLSPQR